MEIEEEEQGPSRNTADFRIRKAQVSLRTHESKGIDLGAGLEQRHSVQNALKNGYREVYYGMHNTMSVSLGKAKADWEKTWARGHSSPPNVFVTIVYYFP